VVIRYFQKKSNYSVLRKAYKVLVGKPEGKRPLGRPRRRWEDRIRIDLKEIVWGVWIGFGWLRIGTGVDLLMW
jgi:hypothetical protein